jgi:hypothetical protein
MTFTAVSLCEELQLLILNFGGSSGKLAIACGS